MAFVFAVAVSTSAALLAGGEPPMPNPDHPVDYLAWMDVQFRTDSGNNAAELYQKAFEAFAESAFTSNPADRMRPTRWSQAQREQLQIWVETNQRCLAMLADATHSTDCYFGNQANGNALLDAELPHIRKIETVGEVLAVRAGLRLVADDFDGAVEDVCTLLRAASHLRLQAHWVEYLAGEKMTTMALNLLLDFPVHAKGRVDYDNILKSVRAADYATGAQSRQLQTDRLLFLDVIQRYCNDRDGDGILDHTDGRFGDIVFDRGLTIEAMIERYDRFLSRWNTITASDYGEGQQLASVLEQEIRTRPPDLIALLMPDYWVMSKRLRRTTAMRNGTYIVLSMHGFQKRCGKWPETLTDITHDYPEVCCDDPFSSEALIYRFDAGKPLLYSVGPDGRDDGGRSPVGGDVRTSGGDDIVWPRAVGRD